MSSASDLAKRRPTVWRFTVPLLFFASLVGDFWLMWIGERIPERTGPFDGYLMHLALWVILCGAMILIVVVPVTMWLWNRILVPRLGLQEIDYHSAFALVVCWHVLNTLVKMF